MPQSISKVVYGNQVLIDLTSDTISSNELLIGFTAHSANGELINGNCSYNADTTDASIGPNDILTGHWGWANGSKIIGQMPNNAQQISAINSKGEKAYISQGYHDGSGYAMIASAEQSKIIADNIREGVTILGVTGTMSGSEDVHAQAKTATPSHSTQVISPTSPDYNYLTQVTVNPIVVSETRTFPDSQTNLGYTVTV